MMSYTTLKTLHILSMVILFGTGLGTAFYKWMADRSGNVAHMAITNRHVVLADWLFTTPTVIFQPLSGLALVHALGLPWTTPWVFASLVLYAVAGAGWLPVVWLQMRMQTMSALAAEQGAPLPAAYRRMARAWFWLGVPAFLAMVGIVVLMVGKHSLGGAV
ncbi:MAG: hypothetical protein CFE44_10120 [Burkholderiales bacterium PBB4]|nr:MAG: hypothetical protein CFE44_10120 [Burkholderiales bacterium PBB4]